MTSRAGEQAAADGPEVIAFDVNETLSDMAPLAERFAEVGAPRLLAKTWFAALLRDGFALAVCGDSEDFAVIGREVLRATLTGVELNRGIDQAVDSIMAAFADLHLHPDVVDGVRALRASGFRLVTLTNGSTRVAEKLLRDAGIRDDFERLLSVEGAAAWKPSRSAYDYAAAACEVASDRLLLAAVHPWDIHGAARAGLRTAWISRASGAYPRHFARPDLAVGGVGELASALTRRRP